MDEYTPIYQEEFYPPIKCEGGWRCFYCGYTSTDHVRTITHQYEEPMCDDVWNGRLENLYLKIAPALYTSSFFNSLMDLFVRNLEEWTAEETSLFTYFSVRMRSYKPPKDIERRALAVNVDEIDDDELSLCLRVVLDCELLHQNAIFYMKGLLPKVHVDICSTSEEES